MANVVLLTHRIPYPPNKGDKVRTYHLLRYLSARHRVFLGTFVDDPEDLAHVEKVRAMCAGLHVGRINPALGKIASLRGLLDGRALTLPYYEDAALRSWLRDTIRREKIDAALLFSSAMSQYGDEVPAIPKLAIFDDVDSAKWAEYARHHAWPMSWIYAREGRRLLEFERAAAGASTCTFFVTRKEAEFFLSLAPECDGKVGVISNGVDADYFSPEHELVSPFGPGEKALVFTGAMDYWPNADAALWFAREAMPRLLERDAALRFHIVGRSPGAELKSLASDTVNVTGTVPDVRPYLRHARLVVAPLRLARGIQNKVLEAMAMGRAVIAADTCAAAIDAVPEQELVPAATVEQYVSRVLDLLADPERAERIGAAARQRVLGRYSWDAHLAGFEPFIAGGAGGDAVVRVAR